MKDIKAMQYIEFENSSTLRFILIRCCTRPLRSTHFFHLNNTNNYKRKNIYKKFGIYKFWYFTLRNLDTISLYKIYIISLVIIINDEKKYIKIYWLKGRNEKLRSRIRLAERNASSALGRSEFPEKGWSALVLHGRSIMSQTKYQGGFTILEPTLPTFSPAKPPNAVYLLHVTTTFCAPHPLRPTERDNLNYKFTSATLPLLRAPLTHLYIHHSNNRLSEKMKLPLML